MDRLSVVRGKPKLLDQLHQALRSRHYTSRTEQTHCQWVKRFIYFNNSRHPAGTTEPEIDPLLTLLAVGFHTFRNFFATHLLESGYDIRTVEEVLNNKDVRTTMIYTHVLIRGGKGVKSPVDNL